jgi:hypothetical protein
VKAREVITEVTIVGHDEFGGWIDEVDLLGFAEV